MDINQISEALTSGALAAAVDGFGTGTVEQVSGMLVGGMLVLVAIGSVFSTVMAVLTIIGSWKLFVKFGEPGWKCLIPFYNLWIEFGYTWKPLMMIPVYVLCLGSGIVTQVAQAGSALQIIASLAFLVGVVFYIIAQHKLSKAFGHGVGFTLGLIFFSGIFTIILGFGKSQYVGNTATGAQAKLN